MRPQIPSVLGLLLHSPHPLDHMASNPPPDRIVTAVTIPTPSPPSDYEAAQTQDSTLYISGSQAHAQPASEMPEEDMETFAKNFKRPEFGSIGEYRNYIDRLTEDTSDDMVAGLKLYLDNLLIFVSCEYPPSVHMDKCG